MSEKIYGYMRVSTREQNEDRQRIAMREYGVPEENLYLDKQSGKDFERPGYQALVTKLNSGDTLVIKSIDRLGRNYDEILEQWRFLTKEKQVWITVLDMPMLDTGAERDLLSRLISEIMLQVLSYVAQQERDFIRQRQKEGIAAAKQRGVHFGQKAIPIPENFEEVRKQWECGEISATAAGKRLGVARNTFLKWARA
ncbi:MAG: recombinase family protein [Oscillospiraceae bacterium]|nr:recombinase family protein [Oscillospiraceae bacterium]